MEGILALIVIVIIFNLLNAIMRAIKGDKSGPRKKAAPGPEKVKPESPRDLWFDEPVYYRSTGLRDAHAEEGEEDDDSSDYEETTVETEGVEKSEEWLEPQVAASPTQEKTSRPSALQGRLKRVLTEKDSLLTAFVFHEIIGPPRSMRRKKL